MCKILPRQKSGCLGIHFIWAVNSNNPTYFFKENVLTNGFTLRTSTELRRKVELAREIQQKRYQGEESIYCNAQMTTSMLQNYCTLDSESLDLLRTSSERYGYSARTIHKLLRLARTSADMEEAEHIRLTDVEKVLNLRELDKSNSDMLVVKKG